MEETTYQYPVSIGVFLLFQIILVFWSIQKTQSLVVGLATLGFPLAGLLLCLYRLRGTVKDNQVGGAVTYIAVIMGIICLIRALPADETPWMVIFTVAFFAGLSVINIINLSVELS
jgi:hypothetical membrane protein